MKAYQMIENRNQWAQQVIACFYFPEEKRIKKYINRKCVPANRCPIFNLIFIIIAKETTRRHERRSWPWKILFVLTLCRNTFETIIPIDSQWRIWKSWRYDWWLSQRFLKSSDTHFLWAFHQNHKVCRTIRRLDRVVEPHQLDRLFLKRRHEASSHSSTRRFWRNQYYYK